jgi:FKBP-type peptidyl-prolyl cis-trans isomerase FklB
MKLRFTVIACILLIAGIVVAKEKIVLKTQKDKASYSIGLDIGNSLKTQAIDINPDALAQGIRDAYSGNKPVLSENEINEVMTVFKKEAMAKQQERTKALSDKNKKEGEAFLNENKKKEGVITLPSGLQYKIVKEGDGKTPKASDTVTVNYRGTLIDGTEFDSSYKRGQPASFAVNGVIRGWTEALQLMKEGSKWQLFIPSNLAYGERGAGQLIGPNAVLIFEVELISVKEK